MVSSYSCKSADRPGHHVTAMPASAAAAASGTSSGATSNVARRTAALVSAVALATSSSSFLATSSFFPANTSLGPASVMAFSTNGRMSTSSSGRGRMINRGINHGGGAFGGREIGATSFITQRSGSRRRYVVTRKSFDANSASALSMIAKSGGKEILTTEQFEADVLSPDLTERPVLVFYSAPWCGPCRLSNPVVKGVMKDFAGRIDVVEVCTDDFAEIAAEAGVVSIPTIQLFYGGELIDTIVGCVAKNVLSKAVTKVLEESVGEVPVEDIEGDEEGGEEKKNEDGGDEK